ncbi:MAG: CpaF family protein, partial [Thermodesulfobacteriota bacterium]
SAIDLIVHTARIQGGRRAVTSITEVTGMNDSQILLQEIFRWSKAEGRDARGGGLVPTRVPSSFAEEDRLAWD